MYIKRVDTRGGWCAGVRCLRSPSLRVVLLRSLLNLRIFAYLLCSPISMQRKTSRCVGVRLGIHQSVSLAVVVVVVAASFKVKFEAFFPSFSIALQVYELKKKTLISNLMN